MFCHNCGKQILDGSKFCSYCGVAQNEIPNASASVSPHPTQPVQSQPTPRPVAGQEQAREHVISGIFGAFLGSLAGVVVMVVLSKLGYVSMLSGIVMLACTAWGYARFGKTLSKKGIVFSILIGIAMLYLGHRLCWSINFGAIPQPNSRMSEVYDESLTQQYAFAGAGMIFLVISLVRSNRTAKKK